MVGRPRLQRYDVLDLSKEHLHDLIVGYAITLVYYATL